MTFGRVCFTSHLSGLSHATAPSRYIHKTYKSDAHQNCVATKMYKRTAHPVSPPKTIK